MKELIEQTDLKNKEEIINVLLNARVTERDIPNLPRLTGARIAGISSYVVQSKLMEVLNSKNAHMDVNELEIDEMEAAFGARIANVLRSAGYDTVLSVSSLTGEELLSIDGISEKSASKIAEAIS